MITENAPAFSRAFCASACCYGSAEDVGVLPIVVTPLEFRDVERQILGADVVEAAHDAALQQRPEAINGLRVDDAAHIFAATVANGLVRVIGGQANVAAMFIGGDQADLLGYRGATTTRVWQRLPSTRS